jgi:hypothetical protein
VYPYYDLIKVCSLKHLKYIFCGREEWKEREGGPNNYTHVSKCKNDKRKEKK